MYLAGMIARPPWSLQLEVEEAEARGAITK